MQSRTPQRAQLSPRHIPQNKNKCRFGASLRPFSSSREPLSQLTHASHRHRAPPAPALVPTAVPSNDSLPEPGSYRPNRSIGILRARSQKYCRRRSGGLKNARPPGRMLLQLPTVVDTDLVPCFDPTAFAACARSASRRCQSVRASVRPLHPPPPHRRPALSFKLTHV